MYKPCYYKKRRHERQYLVRAISSVGRAMSDASMSWLRIVHAGLLLA
ncbi:MAG: hypothetical protein K0S80_677 [Neobacillus sp.]|nr:hypothetical protein [Neobacillus sp.]